MTEQEQQGRYSEFEVKTSIDNKQKIEKFTEELRNNQITPEQARKYIQEMEQHMSIIDLAIGKAVDEFQNTRDSLEQTKKQEHIKQRIDDDSHMSQLIEKYNTVIGHLKEVVSWLVLSYEPLQLFAMNTARTLSEMKGMDVQNEVLKRLEQAQDQRHQLQIEELRQTGESFKNIMNNQQDKYINTLKHILTTEKTKSKDTQYVLRDIVDKNTQTLHHVMQLVTDMYERMGDSQKAQKSQKKGSEIQNQSKQQIQNFEKKIEEDSENVSGEIDEALEESSQAPESLPSDMTEKPEQSSNPDEPQPAGETEEEKKNTSLFFDQLEQKG